MICTNCGNQAAYWISGGTDWSCCNVCKTKVYWDHMEGAQASDLHIRADHAGDTKLTWAKDRVFTNSVHDPESGDIVDKRTGRPAEY